MPVARLRAGWCGSCGGGWIGGGGDYGFQRDADAKLGSGGDEGFFNGGAVPLFEREGGRELKGDGVCCFDDGGGREERRSDESGERGAAKTGAETIGELAPNTGGIG